MKKMSLWAREHAWTARLIIIAIHLVLIPIAFTTGVLFNELDFSFPVIFFAFFIAIFMITVLSYPSRSQKKRMLSPARFYIWQKTGDFVLAASSFCMVLYLGNHQNNIFQNNTETQAAASLPVSLPGDSLAKPYKSITAFRASLKDENGKSLNLKEKKKLLIKQINGIKKAKDTPTGIKILLIVLSVAVAFGLLYALAALSCSISCGGAEGLAIVLFLLGTAGIVFLLVLAIRAILGKKRRHRMHGERAKEKEARPGT